MFSFFEPGRRNSIELHWQRSFVISFFSKK
jgi:hypothetical protein